MKRKHYDLIIAWANGADIQWRECDNSIWYDNDIPTFYEHYQYRVKPITVMNGDVEVQEPVREKSDKPEWKDIPLWVEWIAQDEDGDWFGYDGKPEDCGNCWCIYNSLGFKFLKRSEPNEQWYNTLEKRPEGI